MLIALEGIDKVGKTTFINHLKKYFADDKKVVFTREIGGTPFGEEIRKIILSDKSLSPEQQILLIIAARIDHCRKVIMPALRSRKVVVTDRYIGSTIAYQGATLKRDNFHFIYSKIMRLHKFTNSDVRIPLPSTTIYFEPTFKAEFNTSEVTEMLVDKNRDRVLFFYDNLLLIKEFNNVKKIKIPFFPDLKNYENEVFLKEDSVGKEIIQLINSSKT